MFFRALKSSARVTFSAACAFALLTGAAPRESGYSSVPQKREAIGSKDDIRVLRDEAVKPAEVFKNGLQEVSLIISDTGYLPARLIVRKNIPVRLYLTSASPSTLCFILDEFKVQKGVATQTVEVVDLMPTKAGEYKFYCPVNDIHYGSLVVRD
jgi:heme/copper-type cytochrome/quinol oxidase subunit 2